MGVDLILHPDRGVDLILHPDRGVDQIPRLEMSLQKMTPQKMHPSTLPRQTNNPKFYPLPPKKFTPKNGPEYSHQPLPHQKIPLQILPPPHFLFFVGGKDFC